MKKKTLIIIAACVGLWAIGSAVTPVLKKNNDNFPDTFNDHVLHERIKTFPNARSAPESGDGEGIFVLPDWVPKDATDVTVKAQTTGNAKLMRFTLADTPLKLSDAAGCPDGAFTDGPTLDADWWPQDVRDGAGRPECSEMYQFRVAVKGHQVYAWSNGDLTRT
jgi:hypothetical protein